MTLGARITALRKAAGLSQEALAAKLGVSRQAIGKWEADASLPGLDNLHQLAKELGVSIDTLLTGEAPPAPDSPAPAGDLSLEGVKALLDRQGQLRRRQRLAAALAGGAAALCLGLVLFFSLRGQADRLQGLQEQLSRLQQQVSILDGAFGGIEGRIQQALEQESSLVASWDMQRLEYSVRDQALLVSLNAVPKNAAADTTARFVFVLSSGEALTWEAARDENGVFSAQDWLPLAESYTLNVSFSSGGETQTQHLDADSDFARQYQMQLLSAPFISGKTSRMGGASTFTIFQDEGDYEVPVEVPYLNEQPLHWPVKAWVSAALQGEEVLTAPIDTSFMQPGSEDYPTGGWPVTFYLRFHLNEESFVLDWLPEYENDGKMPQLEYALYIVDNGGATLSYSLTNVGE